MTAKNIRESLMEGYTILVILGDSEDVILAKNIDGLEPHIDRLTASGYTGEILVLEISRGYLVK